MLFADPFLQAVVVESQRCGGATESVKLGEWDGDLPQGLGDAGIRRPLFPPCLKLLLRRDSIINEGLAHGEVPLTLSLRKVKKPDIIRGSSMTCDG